MNILDKDAVVPFIPASNRQDLLNSLANDEYSLNAGTGKEAKDIKESDTGKEAKDISESTPDLLFSNGVSERNLVGGVISRSDLY
jgi:hypothetical protein